MGAFLLSCARAQPEPLEIRIPNGLVAATSEQENFIEGIKALTRGMSLQEVKGRLGPPTEQRSGRLFYHVAESSAEGGYYVTSVLKFTDNGLGEVKIGFGHETRSFRTAP